MIAFAMCSHGLAQTSDGQLRVAFSDQMISLDTLLEENIKIKKLWYDKFKYIIRNTFQFENWKRKDIFIFWYLQANILLQGFTWKTQNLCYPGKVPYVSKK